MWIRNVHKSRTSLQFSLLSVHWLSSNSSPSVFAGNGILYTSASSPFLDMCENVGCDQLITASLFVWLSFSKFSLYATNLNPVSCIRKRNAWYWATKMLTVLRAAILQKCKKRLLALSCLSVHTSARKNSAPTGWVYVKFDIWGLFEIIARKSNFD